MLGLDESTDEPFVIVRFSVNWDVAKDDELVNMTTRKTIEITDQVAKSDGTGHRCRCLKYCATWQKLFETYGENNLRFLKEVSRRYNPDGLFQWGFVGGFKLGLEEDTESSWSVGGWIDWIDCSCSLDLQ